MNYTAEELNEIEELYNLLMAEPDPEPQGPCCNLSDRELYTLLDI